jgi:predicted RNA-binding Zn-ribbon protein involved in translation (DUF1610 family)
LIIETITTWKQESHSGLVTLRDDPEFLSAINCMVSYFYNNRYDASNHQFHAPLLHAQIAVIADKYDCASLFKYARDSLAESMSAVVGHEWADVAALIHEYATTDGSNHLDLHAALLFAVLNHPEKALKFLHDEHVSEFLRSNADLATDMLLYRLKYFELRKSPDDHIFYCGLCEYGHVGSTDCPCLNKTADSPSASRIRPRQPIQINVCPDCDRPATYRTKSSITLKMTYPCTSCHGVHTKEPAAEG